MQDRRIVVSLHGPFGLDKASVYIKCTIEIPQGYPNEEPPWPFMESTAGTNDETIIQATSDLQAIAHAYQERRRHSLEIILRFLLGEQSCDESLALLKALPDQSGLELDQQTELSSSDDDDGDDQYAKNQASDLESSEGTLAVANAQYKVPLPKACGALWADDGRLVCFFAPKEEKPSSLLGSYSNKAGEWTSKTQRNLLEGFGRMHSTVPATQRIASNTESTESGDSDYGSSRSSSRSSSSSNIGTTPLTLMPSIAWREDPHGTNHALSVDESQRSSGGNRGSKSAVGSSKNFISIHQLAQILPCKRNLAEEYMVESDSKCCSHNAAVARKYGESDLGDIWDFVNLLMKDEVPLEKMQATSRHEPVLSIARRPLSPLRSRDSAIDLTYDLHYEESQPEFKGRIFWGSHPFGRRWLVNALYGPCCIIA